MRTTSIREFNVVRKDVRKVKVLFGYAYPSTYRTGMTSLATHLFYSILNSREDTSCERYFRYDVSSPCHSVDSGRPLKENHVVGFSLTYEEDIVNLIQMLELGGVPALAAERSESDPIVLVGGPVPSSNPEPYVDFVDAFAIGEGDNVIHEIVDSIAQTSSREEALEQMAQKDGLYVPKAMQSELHRLMISNLDAVYHPTAQIVPDVPDGDRLEPVFGKSLLVEATRGCGHSCKFCLVGHICRPWRTRSLNRLQDIISRGLAETPVHKVSLISASLGSAEGFEELAAWIVDQGCRALGAITKSRLSVERFPLVTGKGRTKDSNNSPGDRLTRAETEHRQSTVGRRYRTHSAACRRVWIQRAETLFHYWITRRKRTGRCCHTVLGEPPQ